MSEQNEVLELLEEMLRSDEELRREAEKERIRLERALARARARRRQREVVKDQEEE